jgi:hypothetical protein
LVLSFHVNMILEVEAIVVIYRCENLLSLIWIHTSAHLNEHFLNDVGHFGAESVNFRLNQTVTDVNGGSLV